MLKFLFISYITLEFSNGLKLIYDKREKSDIFTFLVLVNSGSFNEEKGCEGLTHFLEHMLFDGNEKFSREELRKNFDKFGLYVNGFTREDYTAYFFSGPDKNFKEGIYLLYLMLFKSNFPDKEFEKEKGVVLQEMYQDRSREYNIIKEKVDSIIYKGTNYSHPVIGYENTIKNLKKEKVIEFYKRFYAPNNMTIFVMGDIDEKELIDLLKKTFGNESTKKIIIEEKFLNLEKFLGEKIFLEIKDIKNSYIFKYFEAPPLNHPSSFYFILLNEILNSDFALSKLKEKNKKILNILSSYESRRKFGVFGINLTLKSLEKDSITIIEKELDEFLKSFLENLKNEDFDRVKNKILKEKIYDALDPVYSVFYLTDYLIYDDPYLKDKIIKSIKNTNFEDFSAFYKIYLKNSRTIFVTLKKEEEERKAFPEAIHILLKNRILYEPYSKNGLSQVFFRALISKKIEKIIEEEGFQVKTYDNPFLPFDDYYHRRDFAYIRITFPSDNREKVKKFLSLLLNTEFDTLDLKKAKRDAIFAKNISQNDPYVRAWEEFENRLFKNELKRSLYGEIPEIENIKIFDLYEYSKKIFEKENMIITYESDKIDSLFYKEIKSLGTNTQGEEINLNDENFIDSVKLNLKQSYIIGGRVFSFKEKKEIIPYIALSLILTDRMQEIIREKMGASYRLSSGVKIFPSKILFYYEIGTDKEKIKIVEKTMENIFEDLKRKIDKEELEIAINSFVGNMLRRLSNPETRSFYRGFYIYSGLSHDFDKFMLENILKVNLKDIKKIAQKVLSFENFSKIYIE
ncbi:MAG: insulinase family protein [candidate division WOR-3 bacterium]